MVKKKNSEQEQDRLVEAADNQDSMDTGKEPVGIEDENIESREPLEEPEEKEEPDKNVSDKVVAEEKNLEEKLAEMQDRYLRLSAEFDNYRKRTLREKIELSKYASEDILLKILPVMDDFERALSHMDSAADCAAMKSGIDLIYGKLTEFLKQNGIKEIESVNCPFNVDLHDAVAKAAVEEESKKGLIVEVIQKGYYLNEKVIRHSKVVVGE